GGPTRAPGICAAGRTPVQALARRQTGIPRKSLRHATCSLGALTSSPRGLSMPTIATVACVLGLALVVLVIWRGRRSPLAPSLALLVLNITAWNFADDRWHAIGEPRR